MKKIVLIGPESTGKTTLARKLADVYGGVYIPEYSRDYVLEAGRELTLGDVMPIVRGQMEAEENAHGDILIIDSNPLASAVYSQWYYGEVPQGLEDILKNMHYDMYLLCYPDVEWIPDEARCMSRQEDRMTIYELFLKRVKESSAPYVEIKGDEKQRWDTAVSVITLFI